MNRLPSTLCTLLVLAGIDCGGVTASTNGPAESPAQDASADALATDSGLESDVPEVILPEVTPSGKDCPDTEVHDGRVCVPAGWFWMSRWTTARWSGNTISYTVPSVTDQPVYLDAYIVDEHEVTHGEYAAYVEATGSAPLPDKCGCKMAWDPDPKLLDQHFGPEISGWVGGKPDPGLLEHPVICVTRQEASEYCAWRGGRLPSVAQWLAAGRGPYPDMRRYPWGDAPPEEDFPQTEWIGNDFTADYAVCQKHQKPGLHTATAASALLGRSPRKVLGLAGNASEHLSTCFEELETAYPLAGPLVRPEDPVKDQCTSAVLVGGTSWVSIIGRGYLQYAGSQTVFRMRGIVPPSQYPWPPQYASDGEISYEGWVYDFWGVVIPDEPPVVQEPAGNDRRSWAIGFRCSYDLD